MEDVKFSIIVPVYNTEKYIDECIQSVLIQSYKNYELILVDDGSVDNSGAICDAYADNYKQISSFHKANAGQLHTREYGIKKADGDFCVFLDSDDTLVPNALEIIYKTISKYECDCVVYDWNIVVNGKISEKKLNFSVEVFDTKRTIYKKIFSNSKYNSLCIKCIKTGAFLDVDYSSYYQIRRGEDLLHSLDALRNCSKVVFIPDALYNYTVNQESVTHTISPENYKVDFTVRERVLEFLTEEDVFKDEDYREYRGVCVRMLLSHVFIISSFKMPYKMKKQLFEQIISTNYIRNFLLAGEYDTAILGKKAKLFDLFKKKRYRTLISIVKVFSIMRRIKKMINCKQEKYGRTK